jgi:hypothetical protein
VTTGGSPEAERAQRLGRRAAAAAGPALLLLVGLLIGFQAREWQGQVEKLAGGERSRDLEIRFAEEELASLEEDEESERMPEAALERTWDQEERLVEGTERAELVRAARAACELHRFEREEARAREVEELLGRGRLVQAAAAALARSKRLGAGKERLLGSARRGFLSRGLVLVPEAEREVGLGAERRTVRLPSLLVEARPGASGLSFDEARRLAAREGKRLLTLSERMALEEPLREADPGADESTGAGPRGPRLEWVVPEGEDDLWRRGYGWCLLFESREGTAGEGVAAPPLAVRRERGRGHPDVAFRSALELPGPREPGPPGR